MASLEMFCMQTCAVAAEYRPVKDSFYIFLSL